VAAHPDSGTACHQEDLSGGPDALPHRDPGIDFTKLHFGRKLIGKVSSSNFGQISTQKHDKFILLIKLVILDLKVF
jgi:hypothetical protein